MNFNRDDNTTPIRFTTRSKDSFSADNSEVGTRPAGDPKSAKNFQKILGKDEDPKKNNEDTAAIDPDEGSEGGMILAEEKILKEKSLKKTPPLSLFELSSSSARIASKAEKFKLDKLSGNVETKDPDALIAENEPAPEKITESPANIYAKLITKEDEKPVTHYSEAHELISNVNPTAEEKKGKFNFNPHFATEQADLSYVNPLALNTQPTQPIIASTDKPALPPVHMQAIIDQLVEKIVQLETGDRTETVITLKQPPILAGADLIVTGFNSAKGEFNITFQKLTQAAKDLLDMRVHQQSLLLALEQKGYAVHIVTTTTLTELNLPAAGASTPEDRNRRQDQGQHEHDQSGKDKR